MPVSVRLSKYIPSFSRKLLLLRKRDTVYTRSINGFSLRKFKVLSVGGSSLKWSKSIEKNSKKANEVSSAATHAANYFTLYSYLKLSNGWFSNKRAFLLLLKKYSSTFL